MGGEGTNGAGGAEEERFRQKYQLEAKTEVPIPTEKYAYQSIRVKLLA